MKIALTVMFALFLLLMLAGHLYYIIPLLLKPLGRRKSLMDRLIDKSFIRRQRSAYINACMIRHRRLPEVFERDLGDVVGQICESSSGVRKLSNTLARTMEKREILVHHIRFATRKLQLECGKLGKMPEIEELGAESDLDNPIDNPNIWFQFRPLELRHEGRVYEFRMKLIIYPGNFSLQAQGRYGSPLRHPAIDKEGYVTMRPDVNSSVSKLLAQNELSDAIGMLLRYMEMYEPEFAVQTPEEAGMQEKTPEIQTVSGKPT